MQEGLTLAGRFELGEAAGSGGMGTVYRAVDHARGETVAVKLIPAHGTLDEERFTREVSALASCAHPGIAHYIAHGTAPEGLYLVMKWIDGESLGARLRTGLSIHDSVAVAHQVAEALADAHRHGVVHRDIKPENLMLEGNALDAVRVVDFGLARFLDDQQRLTQTGIAIGTPGYMSPEQACGLRNLDERVDIFALGCVLYECLAGQPAFLGENSMALQMKVVMVEPISLATLSDGSPPELVAIVERMLAKAPEDRFASMDEVATALAALPPLPQAAGHRGRAVAQATRPVAAIDRSPATGLVMAGCARVDAGWRERVHAAAADWLPQLDMMRDGVVAIRLSSMADAARCGLTLAGRLPEATIVVGTVVAERPALTDMIDRSTQVMSVAVMRSIFARGAKGGRVHVDPATAALLRDRFVIESRDGNFILCGERE